LSTFLEHQLDYIYFFYGLAFLLLASVCLSLHRDSQRRLPWLWLGLFGIIHGVSEWGDMIAISIGDSTPFKLVRIALMSASFICLLEFGRRGMKKVGRWQPGVWIYLPLVAGVLAGALASVMSSNISVLGVFVRYFFALPGGLLAAWVLMRASRTAISAGSLQMSAAAAMSIYSLSAGAVVAQASFFPASVINQTQFSAVLGFPVQQLRGTLAILITAFIWSYYQRTRQGLERCSVSLIKSSGVKLTMIFLVVMGAGWLFTQAVGDYMDHTMRIDMSHQAIVASESVDDNIQGFISGGADPASLDYLELRKHITDVREANPQITSVYLIGRGSDGVALSLVQSIPAGEAPPEEPNVVDVSDEVMRFAFSSPEPSTYGPIVDETGNHLSSFSPVHDMDTGEASAVIGIDFDADRWARMIALYRLAPIFITLLISLMAIGTFVTRQRLAERAETLESAKKRFSELTHTAIMERHWDVGFEDNCIPTCWEVKKCKSEGCPVYGKHHARCWLIAGTFCRGQVQGHFAQKLGDCFKCEVYQKALTGGPVSEIAENFNSLMWSLREKEDMLEDANMELEVQNDELSRLHKAAKEMADKDGLTGLKNHGHFQNFLHKETDRAKRYGRPLSLIMIDLDNFKVVNDKYGHQKGDAVLEGVGKLLATEIRGVDYAARYGGEEFVVVMPEIEAAEAVEAANRLRQKMELLYQEVDLPEYQTSASFGVADYPYCAADNRSLIAAADSALLFAKRQGRNRVAYFGDLSQTDLSSEDLNSLNNRLSGAGFHSIRVLAAAVDAKDQYAEGRGRDISSTASDMARKLQFSQDQTEALVLAARLHDIGKIGVPGKILNKKGKLSPEELSLMRQHPQMGEQILKEAAQIQDLVSAVLYHHERWDGKGYPEGLAGEQIPIMARVICILDAYRAMLSDRPYRKALSHSEAIAELKSGAGSQFDPSLVELFIQDLREDEGRAQGLRPAV
jgi:diguanylate cyclase (GGDEF)-like protein